MKESKVTAIVSGRSKYVLTLIYDGVKPNAVDKLRIQRSKDSSIEVRAYSSCFDRRNHNCFEALVFF
jgi:hypothetical protein